MHIESSLIDRNHCNIIYILFINTYFLHIEDPTCCQFISKSVNFTLSLYQKFRIDDDLFKLQGDIVYSWFMFFKPLKH